MVDRNAGGPASPTTSEIALHLGEFVASVIPLVGGPLVKTLSYVRESRDSRVRDLILDLDARFEKLGQQLDDEFVATGDYARRWEELSRQRAMLPRAVGGASSAGDQWP